jgi:ABC-type multidrug transport system ATPase subunit
LQFIFILHYDGLNVLFQWIVLILYGTVGALFAYCVALITTSPLSAFSVAAGYEVLGFLSYLVAYLGTLTFAHSRTNQILTIIRKWCFLVTAIVVHSNPEQLDFTLSLLSPIASIVRKIPLIIRLILTVRQMRAAFVSINLFDLLCDGVTTVTPSSLGSIAKFGGPILYLLLYGLFLFAVLVFAESGSILPRHLVSPRRRELTARRNTLLQSPKQDITAAASAFPASHEALRIQNVTKSFGETKAVDDVSLCVSRDTVFALLGPSGAGKTVTFSMVSGDINPDQGDIYINGVSVVHQPRVARLSLGICPQFTAIDSQLTVREHLMVYGRLKGLDRAALHHDIEALMDAIKLTPYSERMAHSLSGGNQRKLSLAIALLGEAMSMIFQKLKKLILLSGNPAVLLIDEFSTGVDVQMKREMWQTLRNVAGGKAVIITTRKLAMVKILFSHVTTNINHSDSMEEATALASNVGIMAKCMLGVLILAARLSHCNLYDVVQPSARVRSFATNMLIMKSTSFVAHVRML